MSGSTYWGGSTVRDGKVRRLQAADFKTLVERFINTPALLPYTREEFLAHPDRDNLKDGPWLSPSSYDYEDEGKRGNAYAKRLQLAVLDFDEGEWIKDLVADPRAIAEHLHPLNFAAWTTAKHTPEKPRVKIIVDVAECETSALPRIVRHLAGRMGAPKDFKGVVESSVTSQPTYRPVSFKGETFEAVLATRTNGVPLDVACLPAEDDDSFDEFLGGRTFHHTDAADEALGLFFLPVTSVAEVEELRDVMEHLDPDCSRMEWLECCAALKHQFGHDPQRAEEAYNLFVEWSEKGTKFRGETDTFKLWKSLRPYPEGGRAPVTLRTLFKRAQDAGWDGGHIARKEKESVAAWIELCEDADELMRTGPANIAAMAVRNAVIEESLVIALRRRLKALTGDSVEKRTIYREISRERKRERAKKDEERPDMPNWLRPICFISSSKVFHNFGTGVSMPPEAFDLTYGRHLMPSDPADVPPNGKPLVAAKDFAMHVVKIPQVDEAFYCPLRGGEDPYFSVNGKTYLNTYNPISVPIPDPEFATEAAALFHALVAAITTDPWEQQIIIDYCTHLVQFPGRKIRWITSIQSGEGVGKGILGETMAAVLGPPNVSSVNARVLREKYNDHLIGAVLVIINEMHIPGHIREEVANSLKDWITDDYIPVMRKYFDVKTRVPNYANGLVLTNYTDHIHIKASDRRWFLVKSHMQTEAEIKSLTDSGHFERVSRLKDDPRLVAGLRYWMLKREISPDFPVNGPAPRTKYREQLIRESKNPVQEAIEHAMTDDGVHVSGDIISLSHLERIIPERTKGAGARITHYLTVLGFERWDGDPRPIVSGERSTIYVHRDLYHKFLGDPREVIAWRVAAKGGLL